MNRSDIELLAPAGSWEALRAAIQSGADAVYFGVDKLNMRSRSSGNFSLGDLEKISAICRDHGIKSCLTLNTVLFDDDYQLVRKVIAEAVKQQISALILTDMAAVEYARELGMEVHMSTQVNISNSQAVKFYSGFADVMVLARELTLEQVKEIADTIVKENITGPSGARVRLELFVHGALCMAISGKCYLSLHETGYSANRGSCLQICRRAYTVREKESGRELDIDNEYIMSPADLCTIDFLDKIVGSGVKVLKIEGRARSPEYVKNVTECYNEALNSIVEGNYSKEKVYNWKERLKKVFNRGFWDGYYLGRELGVWSERYGSKATMKKVYIARATNYFKKLGVAEFRIETGSLKSGDEILITGPTTGVIETTIGELRNDDGIANEVIKGENAAFKIDTIVRRADKLYKIVKRD